jgi:hypothetical protein
LNWQAIGLISACSGAIMMDSFPVLQKQSLCKQS